MKKILLVDDDQNVLNALRRELKSLYEIATFDNPVDVLTQGRDKEFDLVISDYKMPEMSGLEFLKQYAQLHPDTALMVLSGEADIDALIRTINETHIYRFLAKPWDKEDLINNIEQALVYRDAILASRDQADHYRQNHTIAKLESKSSYRIALVESDEALLAQMANSLCEDAVRDNLFGAVQREFGQAKRVAARPQYQVDSFTSAAAALTQARTVDYDLMIAAQALADMDGIELLSRMKQSKPDMARILISNTPNKSDVSHAINEAEVQNLLQLHWPTRESGDYLRRQAWNIYQLRITTIQALAARDLRLENDRLATLN